MPICEFEKNIYNRGRFPRKTNEDYYDKFLFALGGVRRLLCCTPISFSGKTHLQVTKCHDAILYRKFK